MLTSMTLFSFTLCSWFFSKEFSWYVAFKGHSFMSSTMNKEGKGAGGSKFWPILLSVVNGFWGRSFSFYHTVCWDFLHLCGCLVLHCLLEASSVYSLIIETKQVQRLTMKVDSIDLFPDSCFLTLDIQLYILILPWLSHSAFNVWK